jgi:hypothetical protein
MAYIAGTRKEMSDSVRCCTVIEGVCKLTADHDPLPEILLNEQHCVQQCENKSYVLSVA